MAKRITIMLNDDVDRKLRLLQAKEILKTKGPCSYSHLINKMLRTQLK